MSLRVRPSQWEALGELALRRGMSRQECVRLAISAFTNPSGGVTRDQGGLSDTDAKELRQWRAFAERTAVNGDPERRVTPDIDMHGWLFVVLPQRDENLDIA